MLPPRNNMIIIQGDDWRVYWTNNDHTQGSGTVKVSIPDEVRNNFGACQAGIWIMCVRNLSDQEEGCIASTLITTEQRENNSVLPIPENGIVFFFIDQIAKAREIGLSSCVGLTCFFRVVVYDINGVPLFHNDSDFTFTINTKKRENKGKRNKSNLLASIPASEQWRKDHPNRENTSQPILGRKKPLERSKHPRGKKNGSEKKTKRVKRTVENVDPMAMEDAIVNLECILLVNDDNDDNQQNQQNDIDNQIDFSNFTFETLLSF